MADLRLRRVRRDDVEGRRHGIDECRQSRRHGSSGCRTQRTSQSNAEDGHNDPANWATRWTTPGTERMLSRAQTDCLLLRKAKVDALARMNGVCRAGLCSGVGDAVHGDAASTWVPGEAVTKRSRRMLRFGSGQGTECVIVCTAAGAETFWRSRSRRPVAAARTTSSSSEERKQSPNAFPFRIHTLADFILDRIMKTTGAPCLAFLATCVCWIYRFVDYRRRCDLQV